MDNHWGPWRLDKEKEILWQEHKGQHTDWIDLDRCTSSAEVLDTIIHFSRKFDGDGGEVAIAGMVRALDEVIDPMANLCSFGKSTTMKPKRLSEVIANAPNAGRQPN